MKYEDARDVFTGKKLLREIPQLTMGESLQVLMGYWSNGDDIICLRCGLLNECCECKEG